MNTPGYEPPASPAIRRPAVHRTLVAATRVGLSGAETMILSVLSFAGTAGYGLAVYLAGWPAAGKPEARRTAPPLAITPPGRSGRRSSP
jgi:hypothetical protein